MIRKILLGLIVVGFAGAAFAQGIKRTPLQKAEFPDGYNTVSGIAEIPAGGSAGRHTHPGIEMGYLLGRSRPVDRRQAGPASKGRGFLFDSGRRGA
jgi:hypothetical protein